MSALKVTVEGLPEGVDAKALINVKPETRAEFDAVIDALGEAAWRPGYQREYLRAETEDGDAIHLHPPGGRVAPPEPVGHPLVNEFAKRIEAAKGEGD